MKNYYQIMGLKNTATDGEIKSAYRLLAKRYHPDVNPGNVAASEKFAALSEAYDVLGDPQKKAEYDRQLMAQSGQTQNSYNGYAYNQAPPNGAQYGYAHYGRQNQYAQNQYAGQNAGGHQYAGQNAGGQQYAGQQAYHNAQQAQAQAQYAQNVKFMQQQTAQWVKKVAKAQTDGYNKGYETGFNEAHGRFAMENEQQRLEIESLKTALEETKAEAKKIKKAHDDMVIDFEAMKIMKRDAEDQHNAREEDLKKEIADLKKDLTGKNKRSQTDSDQIKKLKEKLASAEEDRNGLIKSVHALEKELGEATGKLFKRETALTDLKLENSRITGEKNFYENECAKLKATIEQKEAEIEMLNETVAQWENFSDSLDAAEALKNLKGQWDKILRDTKKKLKNTYYGTLGVLFNATEEEIKESFRKLVGKFGKKAETDKSFEEKLFAVNEAYKVLSDPEKRKKYNAEIGVTDEEIEAFVAEKKKHDENIERLEQEQGEHEFWAYIEEIMYNAQVGDAESQNTLGEMYYTGDDLDRDAEQAVYWFKEAAKSKYPEAFYNLGICFLTGDGVDKDEEKAKGFIKQAEKLGSERAKLLIEANFDLSKVD